MSFKNSESTCGCKTQWSWHEWTDPCVDKVRLVGDVCVWDLGLQNLLHSLHVSLVGSQVEAEIPAVLVIDINYVTDVGPEVWSLYRNLHQMVSWD